MFENMDSMVWYEPSGILNKLENPISEMTDWQRAFLCGLIRQYRPQKLLEIGVAEGGTSAVIMNCISELGLDTEMHSVDLSVLCYADKEKRTGYLIDEGKAFLANKVNHTLHTGGYSVEFLEKIGGGIDFLILDTIHLLPGELLDFLACIPFMSKDAIVVLHDINMHNCTDRYNFYATKVLIDCVVADKIIGEEKGADYGVPNIGAFRVTDDTRRYIINVFMALGMTWGYELTDEEIELYRNWYIRYYNDDCLRVFDKYMNVGKARVLRKKKENLNRIKVLKDLFFQLGDGQAGGIYIYGAGYYGQKIFKLLNAMGYDVRGYVISDNQPKSNVDNVKYISELEDKENAVIVVATKENLHEEIRDSLRQYSFKETICISDEICIAFDIITV